MGKLLILLIAAMGLLVSAACTNETQDSDTARQNDPIGSGSDPSDEIPTAGMGGSYTSSSTESIPADNGSDPGSISDPTGAGTEDSGFSPGTGFADPTEQSDPSETEMPEEQTEIPLDNTEQPSSKPPCVTKPSQVVAFGDSYVNWPVFLVPKIVELAVQDGALQPGETYRDYSFPGTVMGTSVVPILGTIPPQWDLAQQEDSDIKVVITDGGGNDIIFSVQCLADGSDQNPACLDIVSNIMDVTRDLQRTMQEAGVSDIIYFLYPNVPLGGYDILNYAAAEGAKLCEELTTETTRCHLIDTRPAFEGHPEYFGIDPIHPNEQGAWVIAQLIWDTMQANCIGQPVSSGCCAP